MKITVDGGSFKVSIDTEFEGLLTEATAVFDETLVQAKSNDKAILRFLQIILEHRDSMMRLAMLYSVYLAGITLPLIQ